MSTLRQRFNVRIRQGKIVLRSLDSDYHLSHQSDWQLAIKGPYTDIAGITGKRLWYTWPVLFNQYKSGILRS